MLAYLARTLAFSAMARADGQPSEILRTHLHLAKSQPSFLYWAQRSDRPSRPVAEQQAAGCYGGPAPSASCCRKVQETFRDFMNCTERRESVLTLCGGLFICAHQRSCAFVNLQNENQTVTSTKELEVHVFN